MRAFTQLRKMLSTHKDLKRKIESMEKKYDEQFQIVFEAIKQLLSEEDKPKKITPSNHYVLILHNQLKCECLRRLMI